jgi:hypothetical protein
MLHTFVVASFEPVASFQPCPVFPRALRNAHTLFTDSVWHSACVLASMLMIGVSTVVSDSDQM